MVIAVASLLWVLAIEGVFLSGSHRFIDMTAFARMTEPATASLIVSVAMIAAWMLFFTRASAHTAAFTYAETLLRTCDTLR